MPVDLGRFNSTLVYSRRAPIKDLLEDLAELRAFDGKQEKTLRIWTIVGVVGLLGSLYSIFADQLVESRHGSDCAIRTHRRFCGDDWSSVLSIALGSFAAESRESAIRAGRAGDPVLATR